MVVVGFASNGSCDYIYSRSLCAAAEMCTGRIILFYLLGIIVTPSMTLI